MRRITATLAMAAAVAAAGVAAAAPALAGAHSPRATTTPVYYLSLGDSLAQGVQPNASGTDEDTNKGYPNQLFNALSRTSPTLRLVKLGCPGESTTTMIEGGLCTYKKGNQLAQAVAFLKQHASDTQLVTIDMGANDLNPCLVLTSEGAIVQCLEGVIPTAVANLTTIMGELRAVDPSGPIIGMSYYDPLLADWLQGTTASQELATDSVALAKAYANDLDAVYKKYDAPVANVFAAYKTTSMKEMVTTPAFGSIPKAVALLCSYTYECTPPPVGPNEHADELGYGVIASTFLTTYLHSPPAS